jgi:sugar phosphate isomerase/epimerase
MKFTQKMGMKTIHAFFGPLKTLDRFCENMKIIDKIARSLGIVVGVENHEGIMAGEPNISALKEVSSKNIGLTYDFVNAYHAANGEIDLVRDLEAVFPYVVHLHIKDTRKEDNTWQFVQVGTGIMDYRSIFKFLKSLDRQIPMTIELPVRLEMPEAPVRVSRKVKPPLALDQIDAIMKNSLAYLEELWESV